MKNNPEKSKYPWYKNLIIVFLSSFLFILANPNLIFNKGLGFLAWFYYIPVLIIISKAKLPSSWLNGFLYGVICYSGYGYWMCNSYVAGYIAVLIFFGFQYSLLFFVLKLLEEIFKNEAWFVQCLAICAYEYLKTLGFLGFSYGISAYTQWNYKVIIQLCDLTGVFGLNILIVFSSGIIFSFGKKITLKRKMLFNKNANKNNLSRYVENELKIKASSLKLTVILAAAFALIMLFDIVYGLVRINSKKVYSTMKVCAVQSNDNPKSTGFDSYEYNVKKLQQLTDEAIELYPDIEMIIWPETAVVPAIVYNYENKKDPKRNELSKNLLNYINAKSMQFVIGNGHKEKGKGNLVNNYNAALVFNPGENVIPPAPMIYAKNHLVPFTENFPFKRNFTFLYKLLIKSGNVLWNAGSKIEVFENGNLLYSTPICFEDTFSDVCRKMAKNGSKAFISLTNDSWAKSKVCQNQHLAMSVMRSVENRIPSVRCTNSGTTCIINTKGQITKQIDDFVSTYMIGNLEILDKNKKLSLYTKIGDVAGIIPCALLFIVLIMKLILVNIKRR